jgi:hypothetical protein
MKKMKKIITLCLIAFLGVLKVNAQYVMPTNLTGSSPSGIPWSTVATGTSLPVRSSTASANGQPGAVAYYDVSTGELLLDPKGWDISLFIFTYRNPYVANTSPGGFFGLPANIVAGTPGPFVYSCGYTSALSGPICPIGGGSNTMNVSPATGAKQNFPAGTWTTITGFQARIAATVSLTATPTLATSGDAANIASTNGWFNRPWSFGNIVKQDSLNFITQANWIVVNIQVAQNANANILGYGNFRGVFSYTINGVVGQQVGAIVFYSSVSSCTAPTLTSSITHQSCSNLNDGAIDLTATGGSPAPTFAWSGPNSFTSTAEDISNLAPGTYTVIASSGSCTVTATYSVGAGATANTFTNSVTACDSYTWSVNGSTYTSSGSYTSVTGCATEILNLTITPSSSNTTTASVCDTYTWSVNGATYTSSGSYTSVTGCATEILNLTITPSSSNTTTASACDTYTWSVNGATYTNSGSYTSVTGCATEILNLTITPSTSNTITASACGSYVWSVNGATYTNSGSYTSVTGCNTEILNLTITPSTTNTTTASACDTYTWSVNGATYTNSGSYTSVTGCSTEILNLTITPSTSNTTNASACNTYTWSVNGATYTNSGSYTSVTGCATEILNLTITPSTSNTTTASACGSYTWSVNGATYTNSGSYTSTTGCATSILNLTITPSTSNTTTASACDSYTWSVNGSTYTNSGSYTSVTGCATEILNLTILTSGTNITTASSCGSYVWSVNGATYTNSGSYTFTTGCSTEILNLTITPSTSNTTTASACGTYTWSVNGATYTASGSYTSVTGCATQILNLTVTPSTSNTATATGCDTYTWSVNGATYTASGSYTSVSGCNTEILVLTITPSTTYYADADNDTYGNPSMTTQSCTGAPEGYVANSLDCNDGNSAINPAAIEICFNLIDDNCDGNIDEGCGCTNPPAATAGSNFSVCVGTTASLNGSVSGGASNGTWSTSGTGTFSPSANVLNATYQPSPADYAAGSVTLTLTSNAISPCTPATSSLTLSFNPLPASPGAITGTSVFCNPSSAGIFTYSIAPVAGATSYSWTVPAGAIIQGSATGTSISVKFTATAIHNGITGNICVTPNNSNGCGAASSSCLAIIVQIATPNQPNSISGPDRACAGDVFVYSVAPVARATSYNWVMPAFATIIGGAGTNVITVQFNTGFVGGTLTASAANSCGTSTTRSRAINQNILPASASISGLQFDGVCGSTITYTATPVAGAASYSWTLPTGATGSSTTNVIAVTFTSTFTTGNITVAAVNNCGNGTTRSVSVKGVPGLPGAISGNVGVCTLSNQTYAVLTIPGATNYIWTIPQGTILSGQGTKTINMNYGTIVSSSGIVTVKASNTCGTSASRTLPIGVSGCPRIADATSAFDLVAYPNPTSDLLTAEFYSSSAQNCKISLMDAIGRVVLSDMKDASEGKNQIQFRVKGLQAGIYLLQFQVDNSLEQIRIVVE